MTAIAVRVSAGVVSLEGAEGEAARQLSRQSWQLMEHELVRQVVRFGRHANGDAVGLSCAHQGYEVGNRFPHAGPRFDHAMR